MACMALNASSSGVQGHFGLPDTGSNKLFGVKSIDAVTLVIEQIVTDTTSNGYFLNSFHVTYFPVKMYNGSWLRFRLPHILEKYMMVVALLA